jgi:hypothetical protein
VDVMHTEEYICYSCATPLSIDDEGGVCSCCMNDKEEELIQEIRDQKTLYNLYGLEDY